MFVQKHFYNVTVVIIAHIHECYDLSGQKESKNIISFCLFISQLQPLKTKIYWVFRHHVLDTHVQYSDILLILKTIKIKSNIYTPFNFIAKISDFLI